MHVKIGCPHVALVLAVICLSQLVPLTRPAFAQPESPVPGHKEGAEFLDAAETAFLAEPDNPSAVGPYLSALVAVGAYRKAQEVYAAKADLAQDLRSVSGRMGKAFYETEDYSEAQRLYEDAFTFDGGDAEALKGVVFSSCKLFDYATAGKYLEIAGEEEEVPPHVTASLRIYLMRRMGAPEAARQQARESGIKEKGQESGLAIESAVDRITWDEFDTAISILEQELAIDPHDFKARCEYLVALGKKHRAKDVLDQYAVIEKAAPPSHGPGAGPAVPFQVTEAVADALVSLKRPAEARKFYQTMLTQNPSVPFKAYIGIYETSTTLRDWKTARQTWQKIEGLMKGNTLNWMEKHEALTARGWLLIGQDRLAEAQEHFEAQLREAGLDVGFRSGLAHVYYYRGWPRKALEQFKIGENVTPEDTSTRVGLVQALSQLDYNKQAYGIASGLYGTYPYDLHVTDVYETLRVKEMAQLESDARFINEAPGTTEWRARLAGTVTITPSFKIFDDVLHMRAYQNVTQDRFSTSWDRFGAGFSWLIVPGLTFTEEGSWDFVKKAEFGSTTKVTWSADDHFKLTAAYESFSLDIPLRARVAGVTGSTGVLDMLYHESDLREYGLMLASNWLSDGNYNPSGIARMEQTVLQGDDWRLRVGPELYYARYSLSPDSVPYFSPMYEASLVLKPVLQITHYDLYDTSLKSYVSGQAGVYKEYGFAAYYPIGGIAYSQELKTSKTFSLKWTAGYGARVYDGRYTNVLELFLQASKYF